MPDNAYGSPLIVREGQPPLRLTRLSLNAGGQGSDYDEAFIQNLAFDNPECLPISEIDVAYANLVPVCLEMNTPAGPMDALFMTPTGRLVILEAKLWRNPEARRKVVAQILDYAKELSHWSYEDLQRETSRKLGRKGNALYELVRERYPDTDEISFVDGVQQSLARGRFLLLIIGDGVREGAAAIADFLESVGNLEFTFGLVELALYRHPNIGLLVQPRVIARTVEFRRNIVVLPEGATFESAPLNETEDAASEPSDLQRFYREFWTEFLGELQLDDVSQPRANVTQSQNIFFPLPPSGTVAWVSAYFSKSRETVGAYLRLTKAEAGRAIADALEADRKTIETEFNIRVAWQHTEDGGFSVTISRRFDDVHASGNRAAIKQFLAESVNLLINVFRHRMKRIADAGQ